MERFDFRGHGERTGYVLDEVLDMEYPLPIGQGEIGDHSCRRDDKHEEVADGAVDSGRTEVHGEEEFCLLDAVAQDRVGECL